MNLDNKDQIKELMAQCYLSTKTSAKILFADSFYRNFASITEPIFEALDDDRLQKVVIKAPRGWGKSTILNLAYAGKKSLFREKKFIVPISSTATKAMMESENLKRELLTNQLVRKIFGNVKTNTADNSGIDPTFSKEMWMVNGETLIFPRGAGQQIRGVRWGRQRPDLILPDDLEDPEAVASDEQRAKLKQWFFADVMNSVDRGDPTWKIVFIGTLLHENSLLADLLLDPTWHKVEIDLCSDDLKSNWPDFMSDAAVKDLYDSYKAQGLLDVFYREYRGLPIAKETAKFKQEHFKYYKETDNDFIKERRALESLVILDPAKTTKVTSDDTAIVGVGIDVQTPKIFVRDIERGQFHPEEQYTKCFDMADRIGARVIGIEVTSLNEFITYPLRTEMLRQKRFYDIVELKARASKEERISALVPFYRLGFVYHNSNCCSVLESQLLSFPKSKRDDVMDAIAYVVEMLELGERYFVPPTSDKDIEDEYKDLKDEDYGPELPKLGEWRAA